jgi:hypothetical protein
MTAVRPGKLTELPPGRDAIPALHDRGSARMARMSQLSTLTALECVAERLVLRRTDESDRVELVELLTDDEIRADWPTMGDR